MNEKLIEQYKIIHTKQPKYGSNFGRGRYFGHMVEFLLKNNCSKVLDFGCGKGTLKDKLCDIDIECDGYDPAIKEFEVFPLSKYDAVISTDVLEHLDKKNIHEEFDLIKSVDPEYLYFNIATKKAGQILPCGINAHTIVRNHHWWQKVLSDHFKNYKICGKFTQSSGAPSVVFTLQKTNI